MFRFLKKSDKKDIIVFVHGFIGGADTWVRNDNLRSVADYLLEDQEIAARFDFAVFDYFTAISDIFSKGRWLASLFSQKKKKLLTNNEIADIANVLGSHLEIDAEPYASIVLVTHSMGGLVGKSYLLKEIAQKKVSRVKGYVCLAVPHKGANLAVFGKLLGNNQVRDMAPLNDAIIAMTDGWLQAGDALPETIYFQGNNDQIVPKGAMTAFETRPKKIIYTDDDHFSIVTPETMDSLIIGGIRKFLRAIYAAAKVDPPEHQQMVEFREVMPYFTINYQIADDKSGIDLDLQDDPDFVSKISLIKYRRQYNQQPLFGVTDTNPEDIGELDMYQRTETLLMIRSTTEKQRRLLNILFMVNSLTLLNPLNYNIIIRKIFEMQGTSYRDTFKSYHFDVFERFPAEIGIRIDLSEEELQPIAASVNVSPDQFFNGSYGGYIYKAKVLSDEVVINQLIPKLVIGIDRAVQAGELELSNKDWRDVWNWKLGQG